jgi:hypothetical protein
VGPFLNKKGGKMITLMKSALALMLTISISGRADLSQFGDPSGLLIPST